MANMKLLEQLCTLRGISGDEESVRDFIVAQITPHAERVTIDAMGNVIAEKKGAKPAKTKLMLNAHMDEVGLIVTQAMAASATPPIVVSAMTHSTEVPSL